MKLLLRIIRKAFRSRAKKNAAAERYHKGKRRTYNEAKTFGVIDPSIVALVGAMNVDQVIRTTGSCGGHGLPFVTAPPYVSFKCNIRIAAALAEILRNDGDSVHSKLNYFWQITARFDVGTELTYILEVPAISSRVERFRATRGKLDHDIKSMELWFREKLSKEIANHVNGKDVEFKCKNNKADNNGEDDPGNKNASLLTSLPTKWISRAAPICAATSDCSGAQRFATINTVCHRHSASEILACGNEIIVAYCLEEKTGILRCISRGLLKNRFRIRKLCVQGLSVLSLKAVQRSAKFWRGMPC
jgi:hypothetical protein